MRSCRRGTSIFGSLGLLVLLTFTGSANAENRRVEAGAQTALKKAEDDYLQSEFDRARKRLQTAERACGERNCTARTRAALVRDIGVMQFRIGKRDDAVASFRRAKKLDPTIALNPSYETTDLRAAWAETVPVVQPADGDFAHTPVSAHAAHVPLPVYVEPKTTEPMTSIVVRYRNDAMTTYRRTQLQKRGAGWGGYIPCGDVVEGALRYYIQGFDKNGEIVASSGDPDRPFSVPIRASENDVSTPLAALPGETPPRCGEELRQPLNLLDGERCLEDRQCKNGSCSEGVCRLPPPENADAAAPPGFARLWIGVAGSLDLTVPPSKSEVCASSSAGGSYWCTSPSGADYPAGAELATGRGGTTAGGLELGGVHVTVTLDYAVNPNLLIGARFGYVAGAYPGSAAAANGKTIGAPLHAELRATYVVGDEPLTRAGIAPYIFGSAGVARFDFGQTVQVGETKVAGDRPTEAWFVAGPAFVRVGGGARYAFSQRIAASFGLGVTAAIGPGAFVVAGAPEAQLQYGF
jgi:hypothetical protein